MNLNHILFISIWLGTGDFEIIHLNSPEHWKTHSTSYWKKAHLRLQTGSPLVASPFLQKFLQCIGLNIVTVCNHFHNCKQSTFFSIYNSTNGQKQTTYSLYNEISLCNPLYRQQCMPLGKKKAQTGSISEMSFCIINE